MLWVEQFPNAKVLINDSIVFSFIKNAKKAGFTKICLDVKGPEGYVSYRKNNLSKSPYFTSTKNPQKKVVENGFDLLQSIINHAHGIGIKVYASFNLFTEGNITTQDYAVLRDHQNWEEIVQRPEDKGHLLKVSESKKGKEAVLGKHITLAFVEEVLLNYDVDGIILDRCRYDNLYADFSDISKDAFITYLKRQNKKLKVFPDDIFKIDEKENLNKGHFFYDWLTFRAQTISDLLVE